MDYNYIPVESVQERDVDLLIIEELNVNLEFCDWFADQLGLEKPSSKIKAFRSISDYGLGETDILISYQTKSKTKFILVENKIDASFQDNQFERYKERGDNYVNNNKCDEYQIVLIAPRSYCEAQSNFSSFISYESIKKFFTDQNEARANYKGEILSIAIEKERRGYKAINSIPVQAFWKSYYEFKNSNYKGFRMNKPDVVPYNSDWIQLLSERIKGVTFYHKLEKGFIDASIKENPDLKSKLPNWIEIVEHKKSISFRVKCCELNRTKSFSAQIVKVSDCFDKLIKLESWLHENIKD